MVTCLASVAPTIQYECDPRTHASGVWQRNGTGTGRGEIPNRSVMQKLTPFRNIRKQETMCIRIHDDNNHVLFIFIVSQSPPTPHCSVLTAVAPQRERERRLQLPPLLRQTNISSFGLGNPQNTHVSSRAHYSLIDDQRRRRRWWWERRRARSLLWLAVIIIQVPIMYRAGGEHRRRCYIPAEAETTIENNTIKCVFDLANLLLGSSLYYSCPSAPVAINYLHIRSFRFLFIVSIYALGPAATARCNSSKLSANQPFAAHFHKCLLWRIVRQTTDHFHQATANNNNECRVGLSP